MKLTNLNIYTITQQYADSFKDDSHYYPAKINFYIQSNMKKMQQLSKKIDEIRAEVVQHYGIATEQFNQFSIPKEKIAIVNQELDDLLAIEQEVDITMIKLSDLEGLEFTPAQMQALMFMIEE